MPDAGVSRLDLLRRIRVAAERTGEQEQELAAVDDLLALVDREEQPLLAAELLVRRMDLRLTTGREFAGLDDVQEAVRISAPHPHSAGMPWRWPNLRTPSCGMTLPSGSARAEEAVRLARACGSAKALTYALTAQVMARVLDDESRPWKMSGPWNRQSRHRRRRSRRATSGRSSHATLWAGNCVDGAASREVIERWRRSREELTSLDAPHTLRSVALRL